MDEPISHSRTLTQLRVRVTLQDSAPEIWRTLDLSYDTPLTKFHEVLQRAFGWRDQHAHRFTTQDPWGGATPEPVIDWSPDAASVAHATEFAADFQHWLEARGSAGRSPDDVTHPSAEPRSLGVVREVPRRIHPDRDVDPPTAEPRFTTKFTERTHEVIAKLHPNGLPICSPEFDAGELASVAPLTPAPREREHRDEGSTCLGEALAVGRGTLYYEYDFGDSWVHTITLVEASDILEPADAPAATLIEGARRGPLEDSGGIDGYHDLIASLHGSSSQPQVGNAATTNQQQGDDITELLAWATGATDPWRKFDPNDFDLEHVDKEIKRVFAAADAPPEPGISRLADRMMHGVQPEFRARLQGLERAGAALITTDAAVRSVQPIRWLLAQVGERGLKLTPSGYLPVAVVEAGLRELTLKPYPLEPPQSKRPREATSGPLALLRPLCFELGLVRKYKGTLQLTKRGKQALLDPMTLWQHTVTQFVSRSTTQVERDASMLLLLEAAVGEHDDLNAYLLSLRFGLQMLGWTSHNSWDFEFPLVISLTRPLFERLQLLGVIDLHVPRGAPATLENVQVRVTKEGRVFARTALQHITEADLFGDVAPGTVKGL